MYQYVYTAQDLRNELEVYFSEHRLTQAQAALEYAWQKHAGATRINGQPFIVHPLYVAKYSILIGANSEDQICTALLHDVCEDCNIAPIALPFRSSIQRSVAHLTFRYDFKPEDDASMRHFKKFLIKRETYAHLIDDPNALICKTIDRFHNLSTAEELSEQNIIKNIHETDRWLLPVVERALTLEAYQPHYHQLSLMSINLRSLNNCLALLHHVQLDFRA